jgi:hypothetical protein
MSLTQQNADIKMTVILPEEVNLEMPASKNLLDYFLNLTTL